MTITFITTEIDKCITHVSRAKKRKYFPKNYSTVFFITFSMTEYVCKIQNLKNGYYHE